MQSIKKIKGKEYNQEELIEALKLKHNITNELDNDKIDKFWENVISEIVKHSYSEINNFTARIIDPSEMTTLLTYIVFNSFGSLGLINFSLALTYLTKRYKSTATFKTQDGSIILVKEVIEEMFLGSMEGAQTSRNPLSLSTVKIAFSGLGASLRQRYAKQSSSPWVRDYSIFSRFVSDDTERLYINMIKHLYICFPSAGHINDLSNDEVEAWMAWSYCSTEWAIELAVKANKTPPSHKESQIRIHASIVRPVMELTGEAIAHYQRLGAMSSDVLISHFQKSMEKKN